LRREIARHSKRDGEAYDRYVRDMLRHCRFIKPLLLREPPDPTSFKPRDLMELLYLGKHFSKLGEAQMYDTLRFWTMSCADLLDEYFEVRSSRLIWLAVRSSVRRSGPGRRARRTCSFITTWAASTYGWSMGFRTW